MNLHPKILAALLAAVAVAIVSVGNTILNVYPDAAWTTMLAALIPVVVGYLKRAEPAPE